MDFSDPGLLRGLIVSDFNVQNLAGFLVNSGHEPAVNVEVAPFGQVAQILRDGSSPLWEAKAFGIVWTRLEAISPAFAMMLSGSSYDLKLLARDVTSYGNALIAAAERG